MKIRFRKDTNIRKDHTSLKTKPIGEVFANTELEVDETLHDGADLNGKNHWWRDQNGWYYWAGATETISSAENKPAQIQTPETPLATTTPPTIPPVVAAELVALPVPDDHLAKGNKIPEGEWQPDEPGTTPKIPKVRPSIKPTKPNPTGDSLPSPLQQIINNGRSISTDELNQLVHRPAAKELQTRLCDLGILDPEIGGDSKLPFGPIGKGDGIIGANSRAAISEFCKLAKLPYLEKQLTVKILKTLVAANPDTFLPIEFGNASDDTVSTRLVKRILRYMQTKGYWIARSPRMRNIVYVEGLNPDGTLNTDTANQWNDRRIVFRIAPNGRPEMLVNDQTTTEPGSHYTWNPLNPNGAARIAFGQYKAWAVGLHKGVQPALVQREKIRLHRDLNKDGFRSKNDPIDIGKTFGINQHSTRAGTPPEFVDSYSAGCLVGRRYAWHLSFLNIVKQDERYRQNQGYLFISTIIPGDDLP